jgi:hypothetical protein
MEIEMSDESSMVQPQSSVAKLARASGVHVAIACLAMGGWAYFANRAHGAAAIGPATAQGAMSGFITLVLKRVLERMAAAMHGWATFVVPPLVTASTILVVLVTVHRIIGTPEIAETIAVPWSVSTLYAVIYTAVLARGVHERG